ncbi:MAG: Rieske (2Fe-2S) protein [Calditrichia bacterium]
MTKHFLCKTSDIRYQRSKRITLPGGEPIAIFHTASGYFAVRDICPHAGAPLHDGLIRGNQLMCAWHGWKFDLTTGKCLTKGSKLTRYPVELVGDDIYLVHEK